MINDYLTYFFEIKVVPLSFNNYQILYTMLNSLKKVSIACTSLIKI